METKINQYEVFWVNLDPTQGSEMAKIRPCVVVSPNEMNDYLKTVIIAPLTSTLKPLPSRIKVFFDRQDEMVALDHIRSISKSRIINPIGKLQASEIQKIKDVIQEMFVD
ncbi:mRNA interferase [Bacteroidia bacterium]|nr:mRNA interferase [Bacteroidia bacterium]GHU68490.1 mRNA interferase [Bacteroidia bacterium]